MPNIIKRLFPYLAILVLTLFMLRGILSPGFMSGNDHCFHYADAHYLIYKLMPYDHWINGWNMKIMAGIPVLVDYSQIPFLVIAIFTGILQIPFDLACKFIVIISYLFVGAGIYFLCAPKFGKNSSLIMSLCLMLQTNIYLDHIMDGAWGNYFALGLMFVFMYYLDKVVDNLSWRKSIILGLIVASIILSYVFTVIFAAIFAFFLLAQHLMISDNKKKFILNIMCMLLAATMITLYYLRGFAVCPNYFEPISPKIMDMGIQWAAKAFFGPLETSDHTILGILINMPVLIRISFGFIGIYFFLRHESDRKMRIFLNSVFWLIAISLIIFSDILPNLFAWWRRIPLLGTLQTSRCVIYAHAGLYIFAAYGLVSILRRLNRRLAITAFILLFLLISATAYIHHERYAREATGTLDQSPEMANVYKVWKWINNNVDADKYRVFYQNTAGNMTPPILNRSDVFVLSAVFTKPQTLGVSRSPSPFPHIQHLLSYKHTIFGKPVAKIDAIFIKDRLEYYNARYIVTVEPGLKGMLTGSNLFENLATFGDFDIFEVRNFNGDWIYSEKPISFKVLELDGNNASFELENGATDNGAVIKIGYHPLWKASLNGMRVSISADQYGMIKINLPEKGKFLLRLHFRSFDPLTTTVSAATLLICIAYLLIPAVKRK